MVSLDIYTKDIDKLTPGDLENVTLINPLDPENWTEEHRLKLKEVVDRRSPHYTLDATKLEQKLNNLTSDTIELYRRGCLPSPSPLPSRTPSPSDEMKAIGAERRRKNEEHYNALIQNGGRSAYPLELSYVKDAGNYEDIRKYWGSNGGMLGQLATWNLFKRYQQQKRKTSGIFAQYQLDISEYRRKEGIKGDIHLLFDATQQTKVDEWKEYQCFQYLRLVHLRVKAEEGRQEREQRKKRWEEGDPEDPEMPAALYDLEYIQELDLDDFMVWWNWMEAQIPVIAQESSVLNEGSAGDIGKSHTSADISQTVPTLDDESSRPATRKRLRRNRTSSNTKPTNSHGEPAKASRAIQGSRKRKPAIDYENSGNIVDGSKHTERSRQPLRRSQRLMDLKQKKHQQMDVEKKEKTRIKSEAKSQKRSNGQKGVIQKLSSESKSNPERASKRRRIGN